MEEEEDFDAPSQGQGVGFPLALDENIEIQSSGEIYHSFINRTKRSLSVLFHLGLLA